MTKLLVLTLASTLILTQAPPLLAQGAPGPQDWAAIQTLAAGSSLRIETKTGERIEGKLSNFSDTALTVVRKGKTLNLDRDDVQRVYRRGSGARLKSALIGTGVGAGLGVGAAAATLGATGGSDETSAVFGTFTVIGAGIGGALGAALGMGSKPKLIYEAR